MKVLFLDIDGVLVTPITANWPVVPIPNYSQGHLHFRRGFNQFDGDCVRRLNTIIKETGAKIVVSSSWRVGFWEEEEFNVLKNYIHFQGVGGEILGPTGRDLSGSGKRGVEIQDWLDEHPETTSIVILDDGSDMEHLTPFLVNTDWENGIEDKHVEVAIKLLNKNISCKL
jgi:hypothetical protein